MLMVVIGVVLLFFLLSVGFCEMAGGCVSIVLNAQGRQDGGS